MFSLVVRVWEKREGGVESLYIACVAVVSIINGVHSNFLALGVQLCRWIWFCEVESNQHVCASYWIGTIMATRSIQIDFLIWHGVTRSYVQILHLRVMHMRRISPVSAVYTCNTHLAVLLCSPILILTSGSAVVRWQYLPPPGLHIRPG